MTWRKCIVKGLVFLVAASTCMAAWVYQHWTDPEVVRAQVLAARENLRNIEEQVLFSGAQSYMNVLRDTATLNLQKSNVDVLEEQLAHRGGASREARDHRHDGIVAQPGKEARFPVVEGPSRVGAIEHPIELAVGHRTDRIEDGRPEALERSHGFFAGLKRAAVARRHGRHLRAGPVRSMSEGSEDRMFIGQGCRAVAKEPQQVAGSVERVGDQTGGDRGTDRMEPIFE